MGDFVAVLFVAGVCVMIIAKQGSKLAKRHPAAAKRSAHFLWDLLKKK